MISIEEANSERKNLVVLSLAIILFYIGKGHLADGSDSIHLFFVNLAFDNPKMLIAFVWTALWWFAFRFFQSSRRVFYDDFVEEQMNESNQFPLRMAAHDKFKLKEGRDYDRLNLWKRTKPYNDCPWSIQVIKGNSVISNKEITGTNKNLILIASSLRLALVRPFFGSYIVPYLLLASANIIPFVYDLVPILAAQ